MLAAKEVTMAAEFRIQETPGRLQPYAVWRTDKVRLELYCFFATREAAETYVKAAEWLV